VDFAWVRSLLPAGRQSSKPFAASDGHPSASNEDDLVARCFILGLARWVVEAQCLDATPGP
jgi:hypothetical protein